MSKHTIKAVRRAIILKVAVLMVFFAVDPFYAVGAVAVLAGLLLSLHKRSGMVRIVCVALVEFVYGVLVNLGTAPMWYTVLQTAAITFVFGTPLDIFVREPDSDERALETQGKGIDRILRHEQPPEIVEAEVVDD